MASPGSFIGRFPYLRSAASRSVCTAVAAASAAAATGDGCGRLGESPRPRPEPTRPRRRRRFRAICAAARVRRHRGGLRPPRAAGPESARDCGRAGTHQGYYDARARAPHPSSYPLPSRCFCLAGSSPSARTLPLFKGAPCLFLLCVCACSGSAFTSARSTWRPTLAWPATETSATARK